MPITPPGFERVVAKKLGLVAVQYEWNIDSDMEAPTVGWETIALAESDLVVIAYMDRRRFAADDVEEKLEFLLNRPVASQMTAVWKGRIIERDAHAISATVWSVYGMETLCRALLEMSFERPWSLCRATRPRSYHAGRDCRRRDSFAFRHGPADFGQSPLGRRVFLGRIDMGITWSYRLPWAIVTACSGAALALTGVGLQALLRNQRADSYLVGLFAGVSTGALLVFGYVVVLAHAVSGGAGGDRATQAAVAIILAGIVASQMFNALTAFTIACSANAEQACGIMFLLMGNLSGVRCEYARSCALVSLSEGGPRPLSPARPRYVHFRHGRSSVAWHQYAGPARRAHQGDCDHGGVLVSRVRAISFIAPRHPLSHRQTPRTCGARPALGGAAFWPMRQISDACPTSRHCGGGGRCFCGVGRT
ncbi:iron chelate uptake ABC transporter family permease subunit [Sagittula sp. NFXS13]